MFYSLASVMSFCKYFIEQCVSMLVNVDVILYFKVVCISNLISPDLADVLIVNSY